MTIDPKFIHLRVHTEYSFIDGIVRIKSLVEKVAKMNAPAVAITDQNNLCGMVKFYRTAIDAGIKPLIGVDLYLYNESNVRQPFRLTLLCQNQTGYQNITQLISRAYIEGQQQGTPLIYYNWLPGATEGLIALSGGREGDLGQVLLAKQFDVVNQRLKSWLELFPNRFYLELQRTGRSEEENYIREAITLAQEKNVPVVATNDVRFLAQEDFEAHEARVCIHNGYALEDPRRPRLYSDQQYLRSPREMERLFSDIPEALANTVEIAKRCNLQLTLDKIFLPEFPVPEGMTIDNFFDEKAKQGLKEYLTKNFDTHNDNFPSQKETYETRLNHELNVIKQMGFSGYFLIVADFIRWSKGNGIPVGPGRGSGAGSLTAFVLGVTGLDPLEHELLFERFLNPERISMPDFDIDFCMEGRDRVIEYVAEKYGRDNVSQIITYGTMAAKAVVRDVGRVLGYPYRFVDKLAKMIPFELGMTLEKALQQEELLLKRYKEEEEVKTIIDLALKLEGITRNAGKHAGGVVIAPSKLTNFSPLYCEAKGGGLVTQFDKDDIESVGLIKFDFLGLRTLTIINFALKRINQKRENLGNTPLNINDIPRDDKKTYQLLKSCYTTAVFQLESRGMRDLIKQLQPNCFEDILSLVALFRPGPLQSGMVDDFINRRHGRARIEYPHPDLEPILKSTYGVILYQEQVMQIAQVLAGYTLGGADLLRRAMGKKKPGEMAKQRAIFIEGAIKRKVDAHTANSIFDLMEKFAGYGFNRSHSAAYALITYQTAWLKAHYPAEFMAAVLSSDMDNTDKVVAMLEECKRMGLNVIFADINCGDYRFTTNQEGNIVYGLGAIKGVGETAVENLLESRREKGMFKDLFDVCRRVDIRKVNRRALESLIYAGAMDAIGPHRASIMSTLEIALKIAEQQSITQELGQDDLFGEGLKIGLKQGQITYQIVPEWSEEKRLIGEKDTLGFYLHGHPIEKFEKELSRFVSSTIAELDSNEKKQTVVAGFIAQLKIVHTKKGDRMAVVTLEDKSGRVEVIVFSKLFAESRHILVKNGLLIVEGEVTVDDYTGGHRIQANKLFNLNKAQASYAKRLLIKLNSEQANNGFINKLHRTLYNFRDGNCPVYVDYQANEASSKLVLGEEWKVSVTDELIFHLRKNLGEENVVVIYS